MRYKIYAVAAPFAFAAVLAACGDADTASGVQPGDSTGLLASSESSNIESCSSGLNSSSWDSFGGSSAQDFPEGSSAAMMPSSEAVPASSSHGSGHSRTRSSSAMSSEVALSSATFPEVTSSDAPASSAAMIPADVPLDKDGFATVADVYKSLAPTEKAVFIIRHSEREDDVAIETELTANGVKMAQDLGKTLKSDEEFSYITSGFVRTNETANNISKGRGEATLPKLITNYDITGNWFLKISADELAQYGTNLGMRGGSVELMSHWAYGEPYPDALYELEPRAQEFMQSVILKNLPKWKRVSIMVSHDIFVMPLAVFGSKKKVALKYYEDYHWINYIAGLAIIADEQNNLRYIPVKGAESGVIDYLAIYMEEHGIKLPKTPGK
jgi:broad specificity phosphatase PhoE